MSLIDGNRLVGIISHVECIDNQIIVKKEPAGGALSILN